jgi:hypothetical protein
MRDGRIGCNSLKLDWSQSSLRYLCVDFLLHLISVCSVSLPLLPIILLRGSFTVCPYQFLFFTVSYDTLCCTKSYPTITCSNLLFPPLYSSSFHSIVIFRSFPQRYILYVSPHLSFTSFPSSLHSSFPSLGRV